MMKRILAVALFGACTQPLPKDQVDGPRPDGPVITESRYCEETYSLRGTWTAGTPVRDSSAPTGCWPVGTWTFTPTLDRTREVGDYNGDGKADRCGDVTGTTAPTVAASYSFRVNRVDDGSGWVDSYTYLGSHTAPEVRVEVSGDGGGECEGDVELIDGEKVWNFKAAQTGATIVGYGEFHSGNKPGTF
jgi:hypothetical protein